LYMHHTYIVLANPSYIVRVRSYKRNGLLSKVHSKSVLLYYWVYYSSPLLIYCIPTRIKAQHTHWLAFNTGCLSSFVSQFPSVSVSGTPF